MVSRRGNAGQTFQEYIVLYNPGTVAARAQVRYLPSGSPAPAPIPVAVPAGSQVTINMNGQYDKVAPVGSKDIAAEVTSDQPIAVDRVMYWGNGAGSAKYGFSMAPAVSDGSTSRVFPLLPTANGSQPFISVLNPGSTVANVSLKLLDATGSSLASASAAIKARQRYTFDVATILPGDHGNVSGVLSGDSPVVAEAPLYFGGSPNVGSNPGFVLQGSGGSQSGTAVDLSGTAALVRIYDPGSVDAQVQVTLGNVSGGTVAFQGAITAGSSTEVQIPSTSDAQGVVVLASTPVVSTLAEGGVGSGSVIGARLT